MGEKVEDNANMHGKPLGGMADSVVTQLQALMSTVDIRITGPVAISTNPSLENSFKTGISIK